MNPPEILARFALSPALGSWVAGHRRQVFVVLRAALDRSRRPSTAAGPLMAQVSAEPGPQDRGYRPERSVAAALLDAAIPMTEDPDFAAIWELGNAEWVEEGDDADDHIGFTYADMPDLLHVPRGLPDRMRVAEELTKAAVATRWDTPRWLAEAVVEDWLHPRAMRLVTVPKDDAAEFIAAHHSKLPELNPRGLMYAIGVVVDGRLVAVATAGAPSGRWKDPHRILELTRVASDGTVKGAASALVARLLDLLPQAQRREAQGPALFVTYSLTSEEGTTYRALADKGLRPVAREPGKHPGGARADVTSALGHLDKIRWEAGPGARPAKWSLLQSVA